MSAYRPFDHLPPPPVPQRNVQAGRDPDTTVRAGPPWRSSAPSPHPVVRPLTATERAVQAKSIPRSYRSAAPSVEPRRLPGKIGKPEEDDGGDWSVLGRATSTDAEDTSEAETSGAHKSVVADSTADESSGLSHDGSSVVSQRTPRSRSRSPSVALSDWTASTSTLFRETSESSDDQEDDDENENDNADGARRRAPPRRQDRSSPRKRHQQEQPAQHPAPPHADRFLEDLGLPEFRPLSVKARVANELAKRTEMFPFAARVQPVETLVLPPMPATEPPQPHDNSDDDLWSDGETDDGQRAQSRPPSPVDSLEDYEEQGDPEDVFAPVYEDVDIVGEQAYFRQPTRAGAVARWVALLERDAETLSEGYSLDTYLQDRKLLEELKVPLSHDSPSLDRDFQTGAAKKLLSHKPPPALALRLWTDLLGPGHVQRHQPPPSSGRSCLCPLWVPERRRSWADECASLERGGVSLDDLLATLQLVFPYPTQLGQPDEAALRAVYANNWLWFSEIKMIAKIRHAHRTLVPELKLQAVVTACTERDVAERAKLREIRTKSAEYEQAHGRVDIGLYQDSVLEEHKHEVARAKRLDLVDRLYRLAGRDPLKSGLLGRKSEKKSIQDWRKPIRAGMSSGTHTPA